MVKRRFELIELLIVAAIIGILAAMILPALSAARQKQREREGLEKEVHQIIHKVHDMVKEGAPKVTAKSCTIAELNSLGQHQNTYEDCSIISKTRDSITFTSNSEVVTLENYEVMK